MFLLARYCRTASKCLTRRSSSSTLLVNSSIGDQVNFKQYNYIESHKYQKNGKEGLESHELKSKGLNELQTLTISGSLAVFAITWLFFGFGDDDDDGGGMMKPVKQTVD